MDAYCFDIVVVGVGNLVLSDVGVGGHAARALMHDRRLPPGIAVLGGRRLGLKLLGSIAGARHILFLDAADSFAEPGTVVRIIGDDLLDTAHERSLHQIGIANLMTALALVSNQSPEIVLLGIHPAKVDWGTPQSLAVKVALTPLVEAAFDQLRAWRSSRRITSRSRHLKRRAAGGVS